MIQKGPKEVGSNMTSEAQNVLENAAPIAGILVEALGQPWRRWRRSVQHGVIDSSVRSQFIEVARFHSGNNEPLQNPPTLPI